MKRIIITKLLCTMMLILGISSFGNLTHAEQIFGVELTHNKPVLSVELDPGFVESSLQDTFSPHTQKTETKFSMARLYHMSEKTDINTFDSRLACMYNTSNIL